MSIGRGTLTVMVLTAAMGACGQEEPSLNSETHWMAGCERGACGGGLACMCNLCALSCDSDSDCNALGENAACVSTGDAVLAAWCGMTPPEGGVCAPSCQTDEDCPGSNLECADSVCVRPNEPDATFVDAGDAGPLVNLCDAGLRLAGGAWASELVATSFDVIELGGALSPSAVAGIDTYAWTVTGAPEGTAVAFAGDPSSSEVSVTVDVVGDYEFNLVRAGSAVESDCDSVDLVVHVERRADVHIEYIATDDVPVGVAFDPYFARGGSWPGWEGDLVRSESPTRDWGDEGSSADDPLLRQADTPSGLPAVVILDAPVSPAYDIGVLCLGEDTDVICPIQVHTTLWTGENRVTTPSAEFRPGAFFEPHGIDMESQQVTRTDRVLLNGYDREVHDRGPED